jgi:hypothetical protein
LFIRITQNTHGVLTKNKNSDYGTYSGDTTEPEMPPHYIQRIKKNGRDTPHFSSYKSFDQMDRERVAAANEKAKKEFLN